VIVFVSVPAVAHAGFLSFVSNLLGIGAEISTEGKVKNSQTIPLLEASVYSAALGGGDITIIEGALLSELGPAGTAADIADEKVHSTQISTYVVREGDSLSKIAGMFGVSVNTIVWGNNIKGKSITPGQTLVILPVSGIRHTVVKGDTLKSIAKKYGGDIRDIVEYNDVSEDAVLVVGAIVMVPDGEIPEIKISPSKSSSPIRGGGGPEYAGYYMRPLTGGTKTQGIHGYNGIDIAGVIGTPVYAAASGDVIVSRATGWNGGYGSYVVISHGNGTQTVYAHLSAALTKVGEYVVKGQMIGRVGNTGKSTGAHLHFEIRGAKNPF